MTDTMPSAEQIIAGMSAKMGAGQVPAAMRAAVTVAPELVQQVAASSQQSVGDESSPLDAKTRALVFMAAALAAHDDECIKATLASALAQGITAAEMVAVIKIVRHSANNGVLGAATPILEALAGAAA